MIRHMLHSKYIYLFILVIPLMVSLSCEKTWELNRNNVSQQQQNNGQSEILQENFSKVDFSFQLQNKNGSLIIKKKDKTEENSSVAAIEKNVLFADKIYQNKGGGGLFYSPDFGNTWENRSKGLPRFLRYTDLSEKVRFYQINAFGIDPSDVSRIAAVLPHTIFLSEDTGKTWKKIPTKLPIKPHDYFTSVALSPHNKDTICVGTAFHGLFLSTNGGNSWISLNRHLQMLYQGAGFYNEISAVSFFPDTPKKLLFAGGFRGGLYILNVESGDISLIEEPYGGPLNTESLQSFILYGPSGKQKASVEVVAEEGHYIYQPDNSTWLYNKRAKPENSFTRGENIKKELAKEKKGLYTNVNNINETTIEKYLDFVKKKGLNSIVIDCKDDEGFITYDTNLEGPIRYGNVRKRVNLTELVQKAHSKGIYVIGRMVVFKDKQLYQVENNAYALWDKQKNRPWGHYRTYREKDKEIQYQVDYWVDPYSIDVWKYNINIAKELEEIGIDEIQFDYIRFPSGGPTHTIHSRHEIEGMRKTDALASFLACAASEVDIPIGIDVFGFNGWARMNYLGQNIPYLSRFTDVICPMLYPSHFNDNFLSELEYIKRAYTIYKNGTTRTKLMSGKDQVIRPYVQAFLMGKESSFEKEKYQSYLSAQLKGVSDAGVDGFTLWNTANSYFMLPENFKNGDFGS